MSWMVICDITIFLLSILNHVFLKKFFFDIRQIIEFFMILFLILSSKYFFDVFNLWLTRMVQKIGNNFCESTVLREML
jgi:hypothetical protein